MAYQVLALRWRPQSFEDVVGQEHVTRTLQNAIRQDRVPHAFLLTGSRGVGKTTTARILAKALVCETGPTPEPCGVCRFCVEVKEGRSLDVLEIDGASNNRVDEVRDLRENAQYVPSAARLKIYIIDEVHMLTTSAFNALLKILEEPPPHVKFIFATTEVLKVPITIQSRCQRFDFRLVSREEILAQLRKIADAEEIDITEGALSIIASAAEGSLRDSESLFDQVLAFSGPKVGEKDVTQALGLAEEQTIQTFLENLLSRKGAECIRILDRLTGVGYDTKSFARDILAGLRNLAVLKISEDLAPLVPASGEGVKALAGLAGQATMGRIQSLFSVFLQAESQARGTAFPRMVLELAILKSVRLEEVEDLKGLIEKLEAMQGGIAPPPEILPTPEEDDRPEEKEPEASEEKKESSTEERESSTEERDGEGTFRRLVRRLRKDGVVLASFLEHGRLTKEGPEELEVTFGSSHTLFVETLKEAENAALLRNAAKEVIGRKVEVRLVLNEKEAGQQGEQRGRESDLKKKHRREALEHELIQDVIELFEAQVMDIRVF